MSTIASRPGKPKKQLNIYDALSIIIGIVIGAGIYESTPLIAQSLGHQGGLIGIWIIGGIISLIGALCYAELATRYPEEGGDYVYLTRAYGRRMGFLFAWSGFWITRPANIGAIAFIFARYAQEVLPLYPGINNQIAYANIAIIILTLINISGVQSSKWTQNILTLAKVFGLLMIIVIGLMVAVPVENVTVKEFTQQESNIFLAMILVLFTYGGWNSISYVAAEVIEPQKNILRSLIIGICCITLIYVLINLAFLNALGLQGMIDSPSIAGDVARLSFGDTGALVISLLICISCLGNINGMIFTNARVYYAMGQEHRLYSWLGHWSNRLDSPVRSLTLQAIITLVVVSLIGGNENAFARLILFSAPLHWFFFLMVAISLFKFRKRQSPARKHYRVPCYPWLPLMFCLSTGFLLFASLSYAYTQRNPDILVILLVLIIGLVVSLIDPSSNQSK